MSKMVLVVSVLLIGLTFVAAGCASNPPEPSSEAQDGTMPPAQPAPPPDSPAQAVQEPNRAAAEPPSQASDHPAQRAPQPRVARPSPEVNDLSVVATIGEYEITRGELKQRLAMDLRPYPEQYTRPPEPIDPETVLLDMIAEKAMMIEGRQLGYLEDPTIRPYVERQRRQRLGMLLVSDYITPQVSASDAEIDEMLKTNPRVTREQAKMLVQRPKILSLLEQFYKDLIEKFQVTQMPENFAKAGEIHDRLLHRPSTPRKQSWILDDQVREELSEEEKSLVLATYKGGQITVQDVLEAVCEIVPPRRPRDVNTPEGVGRLLDRVSRPLVLAAEAKARGYDENPEYVRQIKEIEGRYLLRNVQETATKDIPEPNEAEITAFFEAHKEWFAEGPTVRINQIWCRDSAAAEQAISELKGGRDFESVWKEYSLDAKNYTPPRQPTKPDWLLYAKQEPVTGDKVTTDNLQLMGFKVTAPKGKKITVTFLSDGRVAYWEGTGRIEKVSTKERFSLPQPKPRVPFEMLAGMGSEGVFWADLWKGEPNEVLGPVKGFYADGIRWRAVKILEKTPAKIRPCAGQVANSAKWAIIAERREAALGSLRRELREKHGYKLFAERIQDVDPLEATIGDQTGN